MSSDATPGASMPRRRRRGRWLCGLALCWPLAVAWGGDDWRLQRDRDGIQVYVRPYPGSEVQAIRSTMQLRSAPERVLALLRDPQRRPAWEEACAEAALHRVIDEHEALIYYHYHLPWPVSDRDVLSRVRWSASPDASRLQLSSEATQGLLDAHPDRVRVTDSLTQWTMTRRLDGGTALELQTHANPAGPIPAWLLNSLSIDGPYRSFQRLRRLLDD